MFRVSARFVVGEDVDELDAEVFRIAGRMSDGVILALVDGVGITRNHWWTVEKCDDAVAMKDRLSERVGIVATVQEE